MWLYGLCVRVCFHALNGVIYSFNQEEGDGGFVAFSGTGQKLKTRKKPFTGK